MKKNVKKLISLLLAVLMLASVLPVTTFALDYSDGSQFSYKIVGEDSNTKYIELTYYRGTNNTVVIPSEIDGCKVVGLKGTFSHKSVKNVVVPEGVEYIDIYTFRKCSGLSVSLPSTLKYIGNDAFVNCNISEINFPEGIQAIEQYAFAYATFKNKDIVLPDSLKYIADYAFGYTNITSVHLGSQVRISKSEYAFGTDILYETNPRLEDYHSPFGGCSDLRKIEADENNEYLKTVDNVLYSKNMEYLITYPSTEKKQSFVIPNSVKCIIPLAFIDGTKIETLTFGSAMEEISALALRNAEIDSLCFDKSPKLKKIGFRAFGKLKGELVIPKSIEVIDDDAFSGCSITSLDFEKPSACAEIGDRAFSDCRELTDVLIPESVVELGDNAFEQCTSLKNFVFEDNSQLAILNGSVFPNSDCLTEINFGKNPALRRIEGVFPSKSISVLDLSECKNLNYIAKEAFKKSSTLTSVNLSNTNLDTIQYRTFWCCENLESVTLPDSVEKILSEAFYGCSSLKSINLDFVFSIDKTAFAESGIDIKDAIKPEQKYNEYLYYEADEYIIISGYTGNDKRLIIPDTINDKPVTVISHNAFRNCNIEHIQFPAMLKRIGYSAFSKIGLKTMSALPETLEFIGDSAFSNNNDLTGDINIPDNVLTIGDSAFFNCSKVKSFTIGQSVTYIGNYAFGNSSISSVKIPDSVTYIGCGAFYKAKDLKSIEFGAGINNIEKLLAASYDYLEKIVVGEDNPNYSSIDGVLCSKDKERLLSYPKSKPDEIFTVPQGVKEIADGSFTGCTGVKEVVFSPTVTVIDENAFSGCNSIESVSFPKTIKSIGVKAFSDCKNLKNVFFEDSFQSDSLDSVFWECSALENVSFGKNVNIYNLFSTFAKSGIKNIDLNCNAKWLYDTFYKSALETVKLYDTIQEIGDQTFLGTQIKSIVIPESVQKIPYAVFADCTELAYVNLNNVDNISEYAFYNCNSLESIDLTGVLYVDEDAFYKCQNLKKFYFTKDEKETYIAKNQFHGNDLLETIVVGSSVNSIQESAFADCLNLENAYISDSVTEIADTAFDNCKNLEIVCTKDSYAQSYAIKNDIPYTTFIVSPIPDQKYTGKEITPSLEVKAKNVSLSLGEDYTAVYSDNINAGTAKVNVVGLGDYSIFASLVKFNIIGQPPVEPDEPDAPVEPSNPVKPDAPVEPSNPVKPDVPVEPSNPVKPDVPVIPQASDDITENGSSPSPDTASANPNKTVTGDTNTNTTSEATTVNEGVVNDNAGSIANDGLTDDSRETTTNSSNDDLSDNEKESIFVKIINAIFSFFNNIIMLFKLW